MTDTPEWFNLLACEIRQLYTAFENAGFNSDQAFELTNTVLLKVDISRSRTANQDDLFVKEKDNA